MVPVLTAGLGQVVALKLDLLPRLAVPIDRSATWRGVPIFGANKTWRGVLLMAALSSAATGVEGTLGRRFAPHPPPGSCGNMNPWLLGAATGIAYCAAELPNSFVKRRLHIRPGDSASHLAWLQYVADQADSVVGCALVLRLLCRLGWREGTAVGALGLGAHIGVDRLMWAIGLKGSDRRQEPR